MEGCIPISEPDSSWVIFPAELKPWVPNLDPDCKLWTPSREHVMEAEVRLAAYLQSAPPQVPHSHWPGVGQRIAARIDHYARQYFGITSGGNRLLYINCMPSEHRLNWREELVWVLDGGEDYFHLLYDPATKEFSGLCVNGEA